MARSREEVQISHILILLHERCIWQICILPKYYGHFSLFVCTKGEHAECILTGQTGLSNNYQLISSGVNWLHLELTRNYSLSNFDQLQPDRDLATSLIISF